MNGRISAILAIAAGMFHAPLAPAQTYPAKPIRIVVPFPAGGGYDFVSRLIGQKMSEAWGQPVVIDNRGGANGNIGTEFAARQAPDGYTLLMGGIGPNATSVALYPKLPYDPIRDFEPVSMVALQPNIFVSHPSLPVRTVRELVQFAKARPGQITYSSTGNGSSQQLAARQLELMGGIEMVHVPYKGAPLSLSAMLSGEIGVAFNVLLVPLPHVQSGKLRALGMASSKRAALAPDIPTLAEQGYAIDIDTWYGLLAPAGTPKDILARLHAETVRILNLPDVKERLHAQAFSVVGSTPEAFTAHMKAEIARWTKLIRTAKITLD